MKVQLKNKAAKRTTLSNAKSLHEDPIFKDVYIKPNLTYEQRQKDAELRSELKRRKANGQKNVRIVRGKIVVYQPPRPQEKIK